MPGLNKFHYDGGYWPTTIESVNEPDILDWIEERIWMIPLYPRIDCYDVLANKNIDETRATRLSKATEKCWKSILNRNAKEVGESMTESFEAQIAMFPNMLTHGVLEQIEQYKSKVFGWKLSGAGGGGYLIFFSEQTVENAIQIRIRRQE
jgi:hypothetical protein